MDGKMTLEKVRDWHRKTARGKDHTGELRFPGPNESPFYRFPTEESKLHDAMADAIDAHLAQPAKAVDVCDLCHELYAMAQGQQPISDAVTAMELRLTRALSGEKAGPVGKYRLLGPNDVIEPDDEFIDDNAVDWVRAGSASGGHLFIGMQYRLGVLKQARRPLPASPAPDKEGL